ncbi:MAG: hypothetical protein HY301_05425 [Verrucomicrobia bacterium]|nr:hypothetical protein [Verrucomicrobiota bacterium]
MLDIATPGSVKLLVLAAFQQWKLAHFGGTTNANAAANIDADRDGLTNFQEFLAGTAPTAFTPNPLTMTNAVGKWRDRACRERETRVRFSSPAPFFGDNLLARAGCVAIFRGS